MTRPGRGKYVVLLVLLCYPLAEWWLASQVAAALGWAAVLVLFALGAIAGIVIVRRSAASAVARARAGEIPRPGTGARIMAGLLIAVPGFLTDGLGLLLLVPAIARPVSRRVLAAMSAGAAPGVWGASSSSGRFTTWSVIQGEVVRDTGVPGDGPHDGGSAPGRDEPDDGSRELGGDREP